MMTPAEQAQIDRLEAKVDRLIGGPPSDAVTTEQAMLMTGCNSRTALFRLMHELNVRSFVRGKYWRNEILNAIAKKRLTDQLAETVSEGRIYSGKQINPHD